MAANNGSENISKTKGIVPNPRVFIGSSFKGKGIAKVVGKLLKSKGDIDVVVWDKLFKIGETYIERLAKALEEFDFAVLVITGEDSVVSDDDNERLKARENVLFELGLFMGRLGRHRAIMLYDEKQKAKLPSDLGGIHRATFSITEDEKMTDEELIQALEAPCKEGQGEQMTNEELVKLEKLQKLQQALEAPCNDIREYILNPYEEAIQVFEIWKNNCHRLYEALEKAPNDAIIRIIQTWFPDVEDFIINLKKLLTEENKRFKLEVLLMNDAKCDKEGMHFNILGARILHRLESRERASMKIEDTIEQLVKLKYIVEEEWNKNPANKTALNLDLEIRKYDFLPFGPFYQVGEKVMFVGFYLNSCSSIHAPMVKIVKIHKTAREPWNKFSEHFDIGWKKSSIVELAPILKKIKKQI